MAHRSAQTAKLGVTGFITAFGFSTANPADQLRPKSQSGDESPHSTGKQSAVRQFANPRIPWSALPPAKLFTYPLHFLDARSQPTAVGPCRDAYFRRMFFYRTRSDPVPSAASETGNDHSQLPARGRRPRGGRVQRRGRPPA